MEQRTRSTPKEGDTGGVNLPKIQKRNSAPARGRRKQSASNNSGPLSLFPEMTPGIPAASAGKVSSVDEKMYAAESAKVGLVALPSDQQAAVDIERLAEDTDPLLDAQSLWDLPFPPWPPSPDMSESANQLPPSVPVLALPISTMEAHADGAGRDLLEFYGVVPRTRADDPEEERRFRARILMEARRGVIDVDGLYTRKADLHLGPMPQCEIVGRDDLERNALRMTETREVVVVEPRRRDLREDAGALEVVPLGRRHADVARADPAQVVLDAHELLGMRIRQRVNERGPHDAEDRRVGTDAERDGDDA